jgi:beta-galactosidase/beta-glucuronidase
MLNFDVDLLQVPMQPHRIHLNGPWTYEWISRQDDCGGEDERPAERLRIKLPAAWRDLFGPVAGNVRFRRPFGKPTNLETSERVSLCFDGVGGTGVVRLNDQILGTLDGNQTSARFDLTGLLESRNVLLVDLCFAPDESPAEPGGLWRPVAIEIQEA